jgi:hypothetical protein
MKLALVLTVPLLAFAAVGALAAAPERVEDKATKDDYELDTSGTVQKIKAGETGAFSLVLKPKNGKKIHPDAPLEVTFKNNAGVKPAKQKLGRGDVADKASKSPEIKTTLTGEKAGSHTLEANISFFICTDAWCQRMTDRIQVPITVE